MLHRNMLKMNFRQWQYKKFDDSVWGGGCLEDFLNGEKI